MKNLTDEQFYIWLAGFMDGEGCIYVSRTKNSNRWGYQYTLRVELTQANKQLLEDIIERVGFGSNIWNKALNAIKNRKSKRNVYAIKWSSRQAHELLKKIYPYMVVKKAQASLGMEFQELVNENYGKGVRLSDEYNHKQVELRELLVLAKAP